MIKPNPNDKFILCSDGLCGFADDEEIFQAVKAVKDDNKKIVERLIKLANDKGGSDNVTIVVLEIIETPKTDIAEIPPLTISNGSEAAADLENDWLKKINAHFAKKKQ